MFDRRRFSHVLRPDCRKLNIAPAPGQERRTTEQKHVARRFFVSSCIAPRLRSSAGDKRRQDQPSRSRSPRSLTRSHAPPSIITSDPRPRSLYNMPAIIRAAFTIHAHKNIVPYNIIRARARSTTPNTRTTASLTREILQSCFYSNILYHI